MEIKKFITRLMYFSIGLAGLMTAIIILVSPEGGTVGKAIATTFLIFLADGIILIGLLAKHEWLKIGTWGAAIYALAMSTIYTWMPKASKDYDYDVYGNRFLVNDDAVNTAQTFAQIMWGGHLLAFAFVIAVIFSILKSQLKNTDKIMNHAYYSTLVLGLSSAFILALCASIDQGGLLLRAGFALMFLSFTYGVITAISMIVSSVKESNEKREKKLQEQRAWYEANPNATFPLHGNQQSMAYPGHGYTGPPNGAQPQNNLGQNYIRQPYQNVNIPPIPKAPPTVSSAPQTPNMPQYPAPPPYPPQQPPTAPPAPPSSPVEN